MSEKSAYLSTLEAEHSDVATRYLQKIAAVGGVDPFAFKEQNVSYNPADFPAVTNMDIVSYLVLTTSFYTKEQMKAYKSLNAFKFFEAGFVTKCGVYHANNLCVLLASVKHSQRMNEPPLRVWVIANPNGGIESGHCTCMAGAGEVCSHIGALLHAVEFVGRARDTTSCTDVRSLWNVPSLSVIKSQPLQCMNFGRVIASSSAAIDVPPLSHNDLIPILQKIKDSGSSAVLLRVMEPFATELEVPATLLCNPFKGLYNEEYETLHLEQLMQLADQYVQIQLTESECQAIEEGTRVQAASREWFNQRAGRITASKLKQVCRTSTSVPSLSLIKAINYPLQFSFKTKETEWGLVHEPVALENYQADQKLYHQDTRIERSGFVIQPDFPQLGASPDARIYCACCGAGCVEIKCPYLLKTMTFEEYAQKKTTCLVMEGSEVCLDKKHAYYFQIQQQMALTKTTYCDFVVWSPHEGTFIERVQFHEEFWLFHKEIALNFHKKAVMPELLGRLFTRCTPSVQMWCVCNCPDDGRPMICCANDHCNTLWYYLECLSLSITDIPNDVWFCGACIPNT